MLCCSLWILYLRWHSFELRALLVSQGEHNSCRTICGILSCEQYNPILLSAAAHDCRPLSQLL